jgi:hypothetical protein
MVESEIIQSLYIHPLENLSSLTLDAITKIPTPATRTLMQKIPMSISEEGGNVSMTTEDSEQGRIMTVEINFKVNSLLIPENQRAVFSKTISVFLKTTSSETFFGDGKTVFRAKTKDVIGRTPSSPKMFEVSLIGVIPV